MASEALPADMLEEKPDEAVLVSTCLDAVTTARAALLAYMTSDSPTLLAVMGPVRHAHAAAQRLVDHDAREFQKALEELATPRHRHGLFDEIK